MLYASSGGGSIFLSQHSLRQRRAAYAQTRQFLSASPPHTIERDGSRGRNSIVVFEPGFVVPNRLQCKSVELTNTARTHTNLLQQWPNSVATDREYRVWLCSTATAPAIRGLQRVVCTVNRHLTRLKKAQKVYQGKKRELAKKIKHPLIRSTFFAIVCLFIQASLPPLFAHLYTDSRLLPSGECRTRVEHLLSCLQIWIQHYSKSTERVRLPKPRRTCMLTCLPRVPTRAEKEKKDFESLSS